MPRAPGRIFAGGEPALADGLVAALRAPAIDRETDESLTHPLHTYPARLHPATARVLVEIVGSGRPRTIVDPFCGSGTSLVEARAAGCRAIGVDLNPLAVLVARAKTWTAAPRRRKELRDAAHSISGSALAAGKAARRAGAEPAPMRKPAGFDPNARNRRLASWFAPHVRRELEMIAVHIDELAERDAELAAALTACLSAILYKVSSRTSDTDRTWVDRSIARGAAARLFAQRADLLVAGLADFRPGPPAEVYERDARELPAILREAGVVAEGVITSPPYAGTYDYAEHQRLRFDFLGLRHRELDAGEIGARRSFEADAASAVDAWRRALADSAAAISSALAPGALAAIVIGDSVIRLGREPRAMFALDDLRGALGDEVFVEAWASQERPMLGAGERRAFAERPKAEHIVLLRRAT